MRMAPGHVRPCPECRAGRHHACDGTTWDDTLDMPVTCPCAESHQQETL